VGGLNGSTGRERGGDQSINDVYLVLSHDAGKYQDVRDRRVVAKTNGNSLVLRFSGPFDESSMGI
jgi:hypothetical protein